MLIIKNDEQIKVGTTTGLVADTSSFIFDGELGTPDYRGFIIVPSELNKRGIMEFGSDYLWDSSLGMFELIKPGDVFVQNQVYNIHFQPVSQPASGEVYSLINSAFFIRDINIPNPVGGTLERINSFIQKYEPECLENILGYDLYDALLHENSVRMTELAYGVIYQVNGQNYNWQGLVYGDHNSLIAYYVYYYYQKVNAEQTTGVGTKVPKSEQGYSASPADKMISAWNNFSKQTQSMSSFLWNKRDIDGNKVYPEFNYRQLHTNEWKFRTNSIYGF